MKKHICSSYSNTTFCIVRNKPEKYKISISNPRVNIANLDEIKDIPGYNRIKSNVIYDDCLKVRFAKICFIFDTDKFVAPFKMKHLVLISDRKDTLGDVVAYWSLDKFNITLWKLDFNIEREDEKPGIRQVCIENLEVTRDRAFPI